MLGFAMWPVAILLKRYSRSLKRRIEERLAREQAKKEEVTKGQCKSKRFELIFKNREATMVCLDCGQTVYDDEEPLDADL